MGVLYPLNWLWLVPTLVALRLGFEWWQSRLCATHLRNLYRLLGEINRLILRLDLDENELFQEVCRTVVKQGGFELACISVQATEGCQGQCFRAGWSREQGELTPSADLVAGRFLPAHLCYPAKQVFAGRGSGYINNARTCSCASELSCQKDDHASWGAVAGFPIHRKGSIYAALVVFHQQKQVFDDEFRSLFDELAANVGFALDNIDRSRELKLTSEVFEYSRESIIIADAHGSILSVNKAFSDITGYGRGEAIGRNPRFLQSGFQDRAFYDKLWGTVREKGFWYGEMLNRRKSGEIYAQRGTISAVPDEHGNVHHIIGIMEDISQHKEAEREIERLANFDALTGLPNRVQLAGHFEHDAALCTREERPLALLFLDLDDFKHVNDALGHPVGDRLLCTIAKRMREQLRDCDVLARFGGDEFVLLLHGDQQEAALLATRVRKAVCEPVTVDGHVITVGVSIGIALFPEDGHTLDELVQRADTAMYSTKARQRGGYAFFSATMQQQVQDKMRIRSELDAAIRDQAFELYYQPQVCAATGGLIGLEALIRWRHPQLGLLAPGTFVSVAEESGQIVQIDRWVMERAVHQLRAWQDEGLNLVPVAINLSAARFLSSELEEQARELLAETGIDAGLIELELTERIAMADSSHTTQMLDTLHDLGLKISIDDFGTGYSCLSYLHRYPVDRLKIDMSFVQALFQEADAEQIIDSVIMLASSLNLEVIAEGVETQEQMLYLKQQGCQSFQGYLFSEPLPAAAAARWLQRASGQAPGEHIDEPGRLPRQYH
jgi:diguanylate cyclase (GGDEF)-like protein/PAS domain S-box-containing protein